MLTRRQREILEFIHDFAKRRGYLPSYQQIANYFGIKSKATIAKHITSLEKLGFLRRQKVDGSFYLEILSSPKIPEGNFSKVEWLLEKLPPFFISSSIIETKTSNLYAYRMPDDSMTKASILRGDLILLEKVSEKPKNAEIVLVNMENSSLMLRRIFFKDENIELRPENENFKTITTKNLYIEGIMRALLRLQAFA